MAKHEAKTRGGQENTKEVRRQREALEPATEKFGEQVIEPYLLTTMDGVLMGEPSVARHAVILDPDGFSHPVNMEPKARIMMELQHDYGNAYVQRVVERIQAKPTINIPVDEYNKDSQMEKDTGQQSASSALQLQAGENSSATPAAGAAEPAPAGSTGEVAEVYNISLWGQTHENLSKTQALRVLRDVYRAIDSWTEGERTGHEYLLEIKEDQPIVTFISEFIGGVDMPSLLMWEVPRANLKAAKSLIVGGFVKEAEDILYVAESAYRDCHNKYYEYKEGSISGAEVAVTGLKVTAVAGGVAAGIATGGAASAAGFGLVTTAGAGALVGGAYGASQETVTQTGEMIAGTRQMGEFDWEAIWKKGSTDVLAGFVGGLAGGALAKGLFRLCPNYFKALPSGIFSRSSATNKVLLEMGLEPVTTPEALVPLWQKYGVEFLSSYAAKMVLEEPTKVVLDELRANQELPSEQQFLEKISLKLFAQEAGTEAFASFIKTVM